MEPTPTTPNTKPRSPGYNGGDALDKRAEALIEREVLACQSFLVGKLLAISYQFPQGELPSREDIEGGETLRCPDCGGDVAEPEDGVCESHRCRSKACGWIGDDPDREPPEVFEWWLVSSWLADQLRQQGRAILDTDYGTWYGRTCTGQGMILDGIFQDILIAMGWTDADTVRGADA